MIDSPSIIRTSIRRNRRIWNRSRTEGQRSGNEHIRSNRKTLGGGKKNMVRYESNCVAGHECLPFVGTDSRTRERRRRRRRREKEFTDRGEDSYWSKCGRQTADLINYNRRQRSWIGLLLFATNLRCNSCRPSDVERKRGEGRQQGMDGVINAVRYGLSPRRFMSQLLLQRF